ncbi:MAG: hypothetical protein KKH88_01665 [Nanoarchaeota archaeon]|nr:hypothetical protein [Nanoarchaeota archaeon]
MKFLNKLGFVFFLFLIVISLSQNVNALGVTPAKKVISFEPNEAQTVTFSVVNNEHKKMDIAILIEGDLADEIKLSENYLKFNANEETKEVKYSFILPDKLRPGISETKIIIRELSSSEEGETFIGSTVAVVYKLKVKVPYPGKYALADLMLAQTGKIDSVNFIMPVDNLGTQDIHSAKGIIDIYDSKNSKVATVTTNEKGIKSKETEELTAVWEGNLTQGRYYARAFAEYDGNVTDEVEKMFFVGDVDLEILEIKINEDFKLGEIAKFNILLENTWTEELKEVYSEMVLYDTNEKEVLRFKTPTESIGPLKRQEFVAYFDTAGMKEGEYESVLMLHYDGRIKEHKVKTTVTLNSIEFFLEGITGGVVYSGAETNKETTLIVLVLILVAANIFWFAYFKKRKKG